jgi:hypothetical protein
VTDAFGVALEEIMENKEKGKRFFLSTEGEVFLMLVIGDCETEINGETVMQKFAVSSKLIFKDGFKIAPGTELTDEVQNEITSNLIDGPLTLDLVRIYKNKEGETMFETHDAPDAGDIFCELLGLEFTEDLEKT